MKDGAITAEDIIKATERAINTPARIEPPIVSHRAYKEIQRIIAEGWLYNGQPLDEYQCWYYVNEWDSRKK